MNLSEFLLEMRSALNRISETLSKQEKALAEMGEARMIKCTHCSSEDMIAVFNRNGIEAEYFCSGCGCSHVIDGGIHVTEYPEGQLGINTEKYMEYYRRNNEPGKKSVV